MKVQTPPYRKKEKLLLDTDAQGKYLGVLPVLVPLATCTCIATLWGNVAPVIIIGPPFSETRADPSNVRKYQATD